MDQQQGGRADQQQGDTRQESGKAPGAAQEPAEGSRETARANMAQHGAQGAPADTNVRSDQGGGISNRGMDPATEQQDLPDRGTSKDTGRR